MKKLLLGLLAAAGILTVSSVTARAGTEMAPSYDSQADAGYWVPPPAPAPAPPAYAYYPSAPYYAGPPPYYYGPPPAYYGPGYYPGPGVHVFLPGIFFGFGFGHHHR